MIYKGKTLFELRYPSLESDIAPILQVCAISDCMQQVAALVNAIDTHEIAIDLLEQTALTEQYFEENRPDVVIMNTDTVGEDYLSLVTSMLKNAEIQPFLAAVGNNKVSDEFLSVFSSAVKLELPIYPPRDAQYLKQYLLAKVVSTEYYLKKLRKIINITLRAMHCPANTVGFACLEEAVLRVLTQPFHYFSSSQEINKQLAELRNVTTINITSVIHDAVYKAYHDMSDAERGVLFDEYGCKEPSQMEFIFATAKLSSIPAKRILRNMNYEPFSNPQRSFRYLQ